jgi:hypothetical protein
VKGGIIIKLYNLITDDDYNLIALQSDTLKDMALMLNVSVAFLHKAIKQGITIRLKIKIKKDDLMNALTSIKYDEMNDYKLETINI